MSTVFSRAGLCSHSKDLNGSCCHSSKPLSPNVRRENKLLFQAPFDSNTLKYLSISSLDVQIDHLTRQQSCQVLRGFQKFQDDSDIFAVVVIPTEKSAFACRKTHLS